MSGDFSQFQEIWCADYEFYSPPGEIPKPICAVAFELRTKQMKKIWLWGQEQTHPPYSVHPNSLFVSFYAIAEISCHLAIGWPPPARCLDLFAEFRTLTNGLPDYGNSLLSAARKFGVMTMHSSEKNAGRALAIRGGPFTETEAMTLLNYCEKDVVILKELFLAMAKDIDLGRGLLRGRYMIAAAWMEHVGVPIDVETQTKLMSNWDQIQTTLVEQIDSQYGVFEGTSFKNSRFSEYLLREKIDWPRLPNGKLELKDDTFKDMARIHPKIQALRQLRASLAQMRLLNLAVGTDGRNRAMLSPFHAVTSRNHPSNTRFIFGPSAWLRGLIKPSEGMALAYVDWSQLEFGIAAALSKDQEMQQAYLSGDPYLSFAKIAGAVPQDATKRSHPTERELFKQCVLAVQYGMTEHSLAYRIQKPSIYARDLLQTHRRVFQTFWRWSEAQVNHALSTGKMQTVFGWQRIINSNDNLRSLANFPMQANGAEILRLACCLITEHGIRLCAPVHDAVLIEAPIDQIDAAIKKTQSLMRQASRDVLHGFELESDVKTICYPDRFSEPRGSYMWNLVQNLI